MLHMTSGTTEFIKTELSHGQQCHIARSLKTSSGLMWSFIQRYFGEHWVAVFTSILVSTWMMPVISILSVEVVTLGVLDLRAGASSLIYHGAAIDTAIQDLRAAYRHVFNLTHTYLYDRQTTNCVEITYHSDYLLSEWFYRTRIQADMYAFISPTCIDEININRLTANWNILMLTTVASDGTYRNKTISPTRVLIGAVSAPNYAQLVCNVMMYYSWTNLYVVLDENSFTVYPVISKDFLALMKEVPNSHVTFVKINTKTPPDYDYQKLLGDFKRMSRVLIFFGNGSPVRTLMIQAARLKMATDEFVYVACEYFKSFGTYTWQVHDSEDKIAREAYRSLLLLSFDDSDNSALPNDILEKWVSRSSSDYNFTFQLNSVPLPAVVATYTALMIFGEVLNETVVTRPTFDLTNGKEFAKLFFNRTFIGLNNAKFDIDPLGERITTLFVNDLNNQSGLFEPVLYQDALRKELHEMAAIDWNGPISAKPPLNEPVCGYFGDKGPCSQIDNVGQVYGIAFGVTFSLLAVVTALVFYFLRKGWMKDLVHSDRWWDIDYTQLILDKRLERRSLKMARSIPPGVDENAHSQLMLLAQRNLRRRGHAQFKHDDVWVDSFGTLNDRFITIELNSKQLSAELKKFRSVSHKNINNFYGLCLSPKPNSQVLVISTLCHRGSLHDLFERYVRLDHEQCASLAVDFLEGARFIHGSVFGFHGDLTGWKCLIDKHFTLKISQLGFRKLKSEIFKEIDIPNQPNKQLYWTAPEILRCEASPSKVTDMFSIAVILYEIMTVSVPYKTFGGNRATDILKRIKRGGSHPLRPDVDFEPHILSYAIRKIICKCWHESPERRPTIMEAVEKFTTAVGRKSGTAHLVDNILSRLDGYAERLAMEVKIRTHALTVERRRCDELLREMLPRTVVEKLRGGESVPPEMFDNVTVGFCDLYGFTEVTAQKAPLYVTDLLNSMYSAFDPLLVYFDVYKMETIGNVYMVASGVPVRNGNNHVREIASLALALQSAFLRVSKIPDIFFRAGIHTGPCAAGVMGVKTPRYCLFGDTVNTASRMDSHGSPNKIHISSTTAALVALFPGFRLTERGQIDIKGKGIQTTFWLEAG